MTPEIIELYTRICIFKSVIQKKSHTIIYNHSLQSRYVRNCTAKMPVCFVF